MLMFTKLLKFSKHIFRSKCNFIFIIFCIKKEISNTTKLNFVKNNFSCSYSGLIIQNLTKTLETRRIQIFPQGISCTSR